MLTAMRGRFVAVLDDSVTPGERARWSPDSKMVVYDKLLPFGEITLGLVKFDASD